MTNCPPASVTLPPRPLAGAGEEPTFDRLFQENIRYVGRTLRYLGVAEASVEDACQEVFVILHRRTKDYQEVGTLRAWVRQVCVLVAHNQRRTVRRRREDVRGDLPEPIALPEQQREVELGELRDHLRTVLDELPAQQRDVFVLFEIEGLTMVEVAATLSCPLQTAYSRLNSARARVRARVQEVVGQ